MPATELRARLLAAPNDVAAHLVYADWLQSVGHPHGELIALHHAHHLHHGLDSREVLVAEGDLLRRHWPQLLGALQDPGGVELTWRLGFIRSARIFDDGDHLTVTEILDTLVHLDTALLLEHVTLERRDGRETLDVAIEALMASPPSLLRSVSLRPTRFPHAGEDLGDIGRLAALPRLDTLQLSGPLDDAIIAAFKEHTWHLRSLTLRTTPDDPDDDDEPPQQSVVAAIVSSLPSLVELRLEGRGTRVFDELRGQFPRLRIERA